MEYVREECLVPISTQFLKTLTTVLIFSTDNGRNKAVADLRTALCELLLSHSKPIHEILVSLSLVELDLIML